MHVESRGLGGGSAGVELRMMAEKSDEEMNLIKEQRPRREIVWTAKYRQIKVGRHAPRRYHDRLARCICFSSGSHGRTCSTCKQVCGRIVRKEVVGVEV